MYRGGSECKIYRVIFLSYKSASLRRRRIHSLKNTYFFFVFTGAVATAGFMPAAGLARIVTDNLTMKIIMNALNIYPTIEDAHDAKSGSIIAKMPTAIERTMDASITHSPATMELPTILPQYPFVRA